MFILNSSASRVLVQSGGIHVEWLAFLAALVCFTYGRNVSRWTLLRYDLDHFRLWRSHLLSTISLNGLTLLGCLSATLVLISSLSLVFTPTFALLLLNSFLKVMWNAVDGCRNWIVRILLTFGLPFKMVDFACNFFVTRRIAIVLSTFVSVIASLLWLLLRHMNLLSKFIITLTCLGQHPFMLGRNFWLEEHGVHIVLHLPLKAFRMVDNLVVEDWHVTGVLVVSFPHVHSVSYLCLLTNLFDNIV